MRVDKDLTFTNQQSLHNARLSYLALYLELPQGGIGGRFGYQIEVLCSPKESALQQCWSHRIPRRPPPDTSKLP